MQAADAGDDPVGLAQPFDESRDDDDLAPVAFEEPLRLVHSLRREKDVAAEAIHQATTTKVANSEADVVADHRPAEPEQPHQDYVQSARSGVHRTQDQNRLAWHRDSEILEQHEPEDGQIAVVVERRLEAVQDAREVRRGVSDDHWSEEVLALAPIRSRSRSRAACRYRRPARPGSPPPAPRGAARLPTALHAAKPARRARRRRRSRPPAR